MNVEYENIKNVENKEISKPSPENVEQVEISQEEFLSYLDDESNLFKQETQEELDIINSFDLDQSTFNKIKNETNIENDLNELNKELEEIIFQAKVSSEPINSYDAIPETVDYLLNHTNLEEGNQDQKFVQAQEAFEKIQDVNNEIIESKKNQKEKVLQDAVDKEPDYEKKVILKEVGVPTLVEPFSDDEINYFRQDPGRLINQLDSKINQITNDSVKEIFSYRDSHVNEFNEQRIEIKNKVKDKVLDLYEHQLPGFKEKYLNITNSITERIQHNQKAEKEIEELYKPYLISDDQIRQEVLDEKEKNPGLSEQEMSQLFWEKRREYNDKVPDFDSEEAAIREKYHVLESDDNFIIQRQKIKEEGESLLNKEIDKLLNSNLDIVEENKKSKTEKKNVDQDYIEILLLGKKISEFPEYVQEKYRESLEKYSQGLSVGMKEKDENGLTSVDKIKNTIREKYDNIINRLGILSSQSGASDNWIYWDLGKQSYLSQHPEESNQNYRLENPFAEQNNEILTDITNRHVGWEVLGYLKHNPKYLDTFDKSKNSYSKIVSLLNEEKRIGKLSSYNFAELGKLVQENKSI